MSNILLEQTQAAKRSYHQSTISNLITNASCFTDLLPLSRELLSLQEFKLTLLNKLEHSNSNLLALNKVYYAVTPLDEVLNNDLLRAIIQYSSSYKQISAVNKHFNSLMKSSPILYQQYTMKIKLWPKTNELYFHLCHRSRYLKISPIKETENYLKIKKIAELTEKCPFQWKKIHKLHIVPAPIFGRHQSGTWHPLIYQIFKQISAVHSLQIDGVGDKFGDHSWVNLLNLKNLFHIHTISNDLIWCSLLQYNLLYLDLTGLSSSALYINYNNNYNIIEQSDHLFSKLDNLLALRIDINNTLNHVNEVSRIIFPPNLQFAQIENYDYYSTNCLIDLSKCSQIVALSFKQISGKRYVGAAGLNPFTLAMSNARKKRKCPECENESNEWNMINNESQMLSKCLIWPENGVGCVLFDDTERARSIKKWYRYKSNTNESNGSDVTVPIKFIKYVNQITHCNENDGLLWRLLLVDKYKNSKNNKRNVENVICMYKKWFACGVAKWIYHLGCP